MDLLTNRVQRNELKPGDHIYTYRAVFTYSHHGIFIGGSKVVHFGPEHNLMSISWTSSISVDTTSIPCPNLPDCGFRQPNSGVVLTCLDCFLGNGSLYRFKYQVSPSVFLTKIRGGTCTTASSDSPETVIHRAMYLLEKGFGNYSLFQNNCEDFALYCKTSLLMLDKQGMGRSGQAAAVFGFPLGATCSYALKFLVSTSTVVTIASGMLFRYVTDIGVRTNVTKVAAEDLAVNLGWTCPNEEVVENEASNRQSTR